jgi:hypothetical protein
MARHDCSAGRSTHLDLAREDRMPSDQLASWKDGAAKRAILDFVARVTREGTADYVPPGERFAVFDNDGTLWCEKPLPVQREVAYQAGAEEALAMAQTNAWAMASIKNDWRTVFASTGAIT